MKMEMFNDISELSWKWFPFLGGWEDFFFISVKLMVFANLLNNQSELESLSSSYSKVYLNHDTIVSQIF